MFRGRKRTGVRTAFAAAAATLIALAMAGPAGAATVFEEDFDGVTAPGLPFGWNSQVGNAGNPWQSTNTPGQVIAGTGSARVVEAAAAGSSTLNTPAIQIPNQPTRLEFRHSFNLEVGAANACDTAQLLINNNEASGVGAQFESGGYTHMSLCGPGAFPGVPAWSGSSGGVVTTRLKLPQSVLGSVVDFSFYLGLDASTAVDGWVVDDIRVTSEDPATAPPTALTTSAAPGTTAAKKCKGKKRKKRKCRRKRR